MKPGPFAYHAPTGLGEVLELLADDSREARVIAGGQSLVPMMNLRFASPEVLVDLRRVDELRAIGRDDGTLSVAAGVRQSEILRDPAIADRWPLLVASVHHIGHPQIRSRGTVCGSLAHADPTAELPAVAVALDARMRVTGPNGDREIAAEDFFVSHFTVALEPGEILREAVFPAQAPGAGWSFQEFARRRGDFAIAGCAVVIAPDDSDGVADARVVLLGVDEKPYRAHDVEALLTTGRQIDDDTLDQVAARVTGAIDPPADVHATSEYRAELAGELTRRAVAEAWERRGDA